MYNNDVFHNVSRVRSVMVHYRYASQNKETYMNTSGTLIMNACLWIVGGLMSAVIGLFIVNTAKTWHDSHIPPTSLTRTVSASVEVWRTALLLGYIPVVSLLQN